MKKKILIYFIIYFTALFFVNAQSKYKIEADSLIQLITDDEDTSQVNLLNSISETYLFIDYEKAEDFARKSLNLARKINYEKGIANAYYHIGYAVYYTIDLDSSLFYYDKAYQIFSKINLKKDAGVMLNDMAFIYGDLGKSEEQINAYRKAEKLFEEIKHYNELGTVYNNLGITFSSIGDAKKAIEYYEKCISLKGEINASEDLAIPYLNAGMYYIAQKDTLKGLEYYKKGAECAEKSDKIFAKVITAQRYGEYYKSLKKYKLAENYFKKSYQLNLISNSKEGITKDLINLAGIDINFYKNLDSAEIKALQSLKIVNDFNIYSYKTNVLNMLFTIYSLKKDYKKAFEYQSEYIFIKDSIRKKDLIDKLEEVEGKYQAEKKELEISKLKIESENKSLEVLAHKQQRNTFIYGFIFVFLLSIGSIIAFIQKRKDNRKIEQQKLQVLEANEELNQINEEILAQRDQIEEQRIVLEHKNYLVTESINAARRIQTAFFQSEEREKEFLPSHFAFFQPKDIVSGDFYWSHINSQNPNIIYISVADCTGHGVPGALMSMLGLSFINEILNENENINPAQLLEKLKSKIIKELNQSDDNSNKEGMDISVVRLNKETNEICFAGANNPLYYINNNEINELKGTKQPIGISYKNQIFEEKKLILKKGSRFYLFSDGFPDQFGGEHGKKYGYKKFREFLLKTAQLPLIEQQKALEIEFYNWKNLGNESQLDDVCIIGVEI